MVVLEHKFSWNCFKNNSIYFYFSPAASHLHPLQVENCDSNSRLVVDEDDNGKLRLERVEALIVVTGGHRVKKHRVWPCKVIDAWL